MAKINLPDMATSANVSASTPPNEPGYLLSALLIGLLIALGTACWVYEDPEPGRQLRPGAGTVLVGLFLIAWGCIFLASYYFSHKSFFLRQIASLCDYNPIMSRKVAAFFYFGLAMISGIGAMLQGLGMFPRLEGLDPIWGLIVVLVIFAVVLAVWLLRNGTDHPSSSGH